MLLLWKSQSRNFLTHGKTRFAAYVCYFPATAIVFKTFFVLYPTQLGFGEEITTLGEALHEKVLHAYYPHTKVFLLHWIIKSFTLSTATKDTL
jgi:hypothetical protein